jgi:hypothetical protein
LITTYYPLPHLRNKSPTVIDFLVMDAERLQNIERRLNEQVEAT